MKRKLGVLVPLIAITCLGIAGCGGDDPDAPTKEEYVAEGSAICSEADAELTASLESRYGNEDLSQQQIQTIFEEDFLPSAEGQLEDLRSLTPPDGDEETVNDIYDALERDIQEAREDPAIVAEGDAFAEAARLADEYGLTGCGSG
ncbi:MAG: hypothetical protein JJE10_00945 [Thermoleophilia bacterium]|nr:hypothetical protein [Thermoleophilia bacterium]